MKIGSKTVSGEKRDLGEAEYPIYESWDEVLNDSKHGIGEAKGLQLINAQVRTNAMNILRTAMTKGPSKTTLRTTAMNEIIQEVAGGNHTEVIGNEAALLALVEARMEEIDARMRAAVGGSDDDDD